MSKSTAKMERKKILEAHGVFKALSDLSFKSTKATHGIIRNLTFLEKLDEDIRETLIKIRDEHIKKDKDGKPKYLYRKDEDGKYVKDARGNKVPVGYDWLKDGESDSIEQQTEYLSEEEEFEYYKMKEEWLSPCYRYVTNGQHAAAQREELFISPSDIKKILFALEVEEEEQTE